MGNKAKAKTGHQPIALHLKAWRKHRGLSQEQLAERIGTTTATISRIENAKQNWDQEFLRLAADELRCMPQDLLMRDPTDHEGLWSIWDQLQPVERLQAVEIIKTIKRTGTKG